MLDFQCLSIGTHFQVTGFFAFGNFGVQRGPFRTGFATLEAEADLLAGATTITRLRVDRHIPSVEFLVADFLGASRKDLVVVIARETRNAVGTGGSHLVFGASVVRFKVFECNGPVEQIGASDIAVVCARLEFVLLKAQ